MRTLCVLFLLMTSVFGDSPQGYTQAQSYAKNLLNKTKIQTINPSMVPGFETALPKETLLDKNSIGDETVREASKNEVAQHINESSTARPSYKIDPDSNPLFVQANEVLKDPEGALVDKFEESESSEETTTHTCEEGGDEYVRSCHKHLEIVLKIVAPQQKTERYCDGHWKNKFLGTKDYCNPGCQIRVTGETPKQVTVEKETWVDGCQVLEDLADQGVCRYLEKKESPKNETRSIQGEPITRDHFEETYTYSCSQSVVRGCQSLKAMGCQQINSSCKQRENGVCVVWEQTYRCGGTKSLKRYKSKGTKSPFCLTGNCADTSYQANGEIFEALSQMSVLNAAQTDMRSVGSIFKGNSKGCIKNCIDFKDCCGGEKGWGVDIGLSSCTDEDRQLSDLRKNNRCVKVGTYCAEKSMGVCLKKKTSFCCFGTKLSKIIQEQGRKQLGLSWGTPEKPECRGLTPEELSRLDFSKMDLSDLYEDIKKNFKPKSQTETTKTITLDRVKENMKQKVG